VLNPSNGAASECIGALENWGCYCGREYSFEESDSDTRTQKIFDKNT